MGIPGPGVDNYLCSRHRCGQVLLSLFLASFFKPTLADGLSLVSEPIYQPLRSDRI